MDSRSSSLEDPAGLVEIEQPFVARWQRLVSSTNWEKGRIIHEWRTALIAAGSNSADYADETWCERVGGVTPQHVGRLRRVYQRFSSDYEKFAGLFWSHFQAALDWNDAEMWLEGAVQNSWSISEMRRTRTEAIGAVAGAAADESSDEPEMDEDFTVAPFEPFDGPGAARLESPSAPGHSPSMSSTDEDGQEDADDESDSDRGALIYAEDDGETSIEFVQPFEDLAELPPDFAEAFDALKLAILRHKADSWAQISLDDVVAALDALKQLARAPSSDA